jgi:RHS repeat-associated protein
MTFAGETPLTERISLSFETDSLSKETKNFNNVVLTREQTEGHKNSSFVGKLDKQKGQISSKVLRLKQGEKLAVEVFAKYDVTDLPIPYQMAKSNKINGLDVVSLLSVGEIGVSNTENKSKIVNFNLLGLLPIIKKITKSTSKVPPSGVRGLPAAYLEITTYKDSLLSEVLAEKRLMIGAEAQENWLQVADSVVFKENVFVVVKLVNHADIPVLFDNLELRTYGTEKAVIVQENHYEPFGMTLKGLDYVSEGARKNNFLFNGKELEESLDLQLYDYHARQVDPQTGRMNSVDPLADKFASISSFNYALNNPMKFIDPTGMAAQSVQDMIQDAWDNTKEGENKYFKVEQSEITQTRNLNIYDINGSLISGKSSDGEAAVSISNGENNVESTGMNQTDLDDAAKRAYHEDFYSYAGTEGVAWAIINGVNKFSKGSVKKYFDSGVVSWRLDTRGTGGKEWDRIKKNWKGDVIKNTYAALFRAILKIGDDPTNQATHWSGEDFPRKGNDYHKAMYGGIYIQEEHYNAMLEIYPNAKLSSRVYTAKSDNWGNKNNVVYRSSAFISHTIFWIQTK